ncbi:hypothetical protein PADco_1490 [Candidatus Profftella armatura (Diaphorina cf. continua)]|uniref:ABC transporter ATP-binding protein n=1 Tax=Candidatus Profftella armatura (Diaphorina cf. continua) TaxID=2661583 RepID=A0A7R6VZS9_9PROT|nr:hypothetical protein [Candidatus Profftella armatura (Diaphorina cf. continua)]BCG49569.1 hypothetical protein PADco_1490 [Candidatus Profftella armatura (Diaphorina cf. continua)]
MGKFGSNKSITGYLMILIDNLYQIVEGKILFNGEDLFNLSKKRMCYIFRNYIVIIFLRSNG